MRAWFRKTVIETTCPPIDESVGPALVELTSKGGLVFHNLDHDAELAAVELGFSKEELSWCFKLSRDWEGIVLSYLGRPHLRGDLNIPIAFQKQLKRVSKSLRTTFKMACEEAGYRRPSTEWVDRAGMDFGLDINTIKPSDREKVVGDPEKVWHSPFGKRDYPGTYVGTYVKVSVITTLYSYITMLNKIPDGVVYDPKQGIWCLVAAIDKVVDKNTLIVSAGKQGRGVFVIPMKALVQKDDDGDWVIKKWLP